MNGNTIAVTEQHNTTRQRFQLIWNRAVVSGRPIVFWREPNEPVRRLIVSDHAVRPETDGLLEDSDSGFVFAPFDRNEKPYFLRGDLQFTIQEVAGVQPVNNRAREWLSDPANQEAQSAGIKFFFGIEKKSGTNISGRQDFENMVDRALDAIMTGQFEKVVVSRLKDVDLSAMPDPYDLFESLCIMHSNALVSLVSIPGVGTWLGATPEVLVHLEQGRLFSTSALAGTQAFMPGTDLRNVAWRQKEIEEQALVSRYIINCFKQIRLREFEEHGPRTIVAGHLLHLNTDFTVDMEAVAFPQLGSVMLKLLHPTSAVCGMPMDPALDFIHTHEGFDRQFYAGYLGPVNIETNTSVFVNLRCMQLFEKNAFVYAGAGVTADSDPTREWLETEMKMNALLTVM